VGGGELILFVTVNAVSLQNNFTLIKILSKVHTIQYFWKEYLVKLCPNLPYSLLSFLAIVRACLKQKFKPKYAKKCVIFVGKS